MLMFDNIEQIQFAVYKLTFTDRLSKETPPYYYIGSKTKFRIIDGVMYTDRNKPYLGSSRYRGYSDICQNDTPKLEILGLFESSKEMLEHEASEQVKVDAANNIEYFNLSIANTKSNYTMSGYGTYKHKDDYNKVRRLRVDDSLVLSGVFVGVSSGHVFTNEERQKRGRSGKENDFYGRTHSDETKALIASKNKGKKSSAETRRKQSKKLKGIKKSEDWRRKIGLKSAGFVMLKHIDTGHCVKVKKDTYEHNQYVNNGYINPYKYAALKDELKLIECPHCGKTSNGAANMKRWHFDNCKQLKETKNEDQND